MWFNDEEYEFLLPGNEDAADTETFRVLGIVPEFGS
jgi:hypothetical protein